MLNEHEIKELKELLPEDIEIFKIEDGASYLIFARKEIMPIETAKHIGKFFHTKCRSKLGIIVLKDLKDIPKIFKID
jgi:hypothetical protein